MKQIGLIRNTLPETSIKNPIVEENFTHSICLGETGSGKTTGFIYPNIENRIASNHGILLYDFKGKEHLALKVIAKKYGKLDQVIEIGKPYAHPTNIMNLLPETSFIKMLESSLNTNTFDWWSQAGLELGISTFRILKTLSNINQRFKEDSIEFDWSVNVPFSRKVYTKNGTEIIPVHYRPELSFFAFNLALKSSKSFVGVA